MVTNETSLGGSLPQQLPLTFEHSPPPFIGAVSVLCFLFVFLSHSAGATNGVTWGGHLAQIVKVLGGATAVTPLKD